MHVAHLRGQGMGRLLRAFTRPVPVAHVEGQAQVEPVRRGRAEEILQPGQRAGGGGLVILDHEFDNAGLQPLAQCAQRRMRSVAEAADGHLDARRTQGLRRGLCAFQCAEVEAAVGAPEVVGA